MHESSAMEAVHRTKRMRSGSYSATKDDEGLSSCIPRPPTAMGMGMGLAATVPVPVPMPVPAVSSMAPAANSTAMRAVQRSYYAPHAAPHAAPARMDTDVHADEAEAEALVEAFVHEATAAPPSPAPSSESDGADEERASCSSGSDCDADCEPAAELFGPGELARGCTFDEACRMLLDTVPDGGDEEATDGPCALDW